MQHYGLLGYPLGHSFSAHYFADKFASSNIDADYRNFEYETIDEALADVLKIDGLRGFNVTIPHKQHIIPYLDSLSSEAAAVGAVNVVRVEKDGGGNTILHGFNSDIIGFCESIRPLLNSDIHSHALVLGTGGASKAVVYALRQLHVEPLCVSRRAQPQCVTYADITPQIINRCKIIVNCTPLGMYPKVESCPDIPYHLLTPQHILFDLVYNPDLTEFMKRGVQYGATIKNGFEMLHLQAEVAWDIWQEE